ncbi:PROMASTIGOTE SURFACE ANTIGEN PROTEIN PSA [Salix purpurea]|uniref:PROMASTIGOTE SURFACE ANTIGEN PROTEIN PSA n=1 Tax=Salix purpurea TaxID=77065 RepID=A0A9Q0Q0Q9_SALPP|nr:PROMASTIGOTE SURFACE ANTIGEN PROTEIN PSA [Salix purpurea]
MGVLSFCFLVFCVSQVVSGQQTTGPNEVDALNKLIDYWNLRDRLNITDDPYIQNATWATEKSNPRVACDCGGDTCHITHLSNHFLSNVEAQAKRLHRSGVEYEGDSETMESASPYTSSENLWTVSSTGNFIPSPNGPLDQNI